MYESIVYIGHDTPSNILNVENIQALSKAGKRKKNMTREKASKILYSSPIKNSIRKECTIKRAKEIFKERKGKQKLFRKRGELKSEKVNPTLHSHLVSNKNLFSLESIKKYNI